MRSITVKIILVLVIISLMGALFTAFFVQYRTQNAFNNFILDENVSLFTEVLTDYYKSHPDWDGVEDYFRSRNHPQMGMGMPGGSGENINPTMFRGPNPFLLIDQQGEIIAGGTKHEGYMIGDQISEKDLSNGYELTEDGETIGWLVNNPLPEPKPGTQIAFLKNIRQALIFSTLITLLIALILGGFLIRSLTRPIHNLVAATEKVSHGDLGYQAKVHSKDDLGQLTHSFNKMSKDLEKADLSRKQMTADIAHDLRTPLTILQGYTESLKEGKLTGSPEIFQTMHKQAQHLNFLIDDLKTLSLLDSEELPFQIQNIDPTLILQQVKAAFHSLALEKGIQISSDIQTDLPQVDLDPDRLTQILGNLINNALNVLSSERNIQIAAREDEGHLIIQISDDGPGISKDDLPQIFNRSYRTDKSRAGSGSSGLGLAITKKLVEAQGGEISVESLVGQGTTFCLRFPAQ